MSIIHIIRARLRFLWRADKEPLEAFLCLLTIVWATLLLVLPTPIPALDPHINQPGWQAITLIMLTGCLHTAALIAGSRMLRIVSLVAETCIWGIVAAMLYSLIHVSTAFSIYGMFSLASGLCLIHLIYVAPSDFEGEDHEPTTSLPAAPGNLDQR